MSWSLRDCPDCPSQGPMLEPRGVVMALILRPHGSWSGRAGCIKVAGLREVPRWINSTRAAEGHLWGRWGGLGEFLPALGQEAGWQRSELCFPRQRWEGQPEDSPPQPLHPRPPRASSCHAWVVTLAFGAQGAADTACSACQGMLPASLEMSGWWVAGPA